MQASKASGFKGQAGGAGAPTIILAADSWGGRHDRGTVNGKAATVDHRWVVLARELAAAGLWDHAPPGLRAAEQARIADGGYPFASDVVEEICFFADGEALAEGGVERFLAELAPALRQHGLRLQVRAVQDPYRAGDPNLDHVVEINGIRCIIWEPGEWEVGYPSFPVADGQP
jgi:hypothetical protein